MKEVVARVNNEIGFHARPVAIFVKAASQFKSEIVVTKGNSSADGKSILSLLSLGANCGDCITVKAEGPDEEKAVHVLRELVENGITEPKG
jgi:phosphotransferase system HPr (HPr) family protein